MLERGTGAATQGAYGRHTRPLEASRQRQRLHRRSGGHRAVERVSGRRVAVDELEEVLAERRLDAAATVTHHRVGVARCSPEPVAGRELHPATPRVPVVTPHPLRYAI